MKNTLLVSGCSITHGSELHHPFYHELNIQGSYSAEIARTLGLTLSNLALPGASNEHIYNSLATALRHGTPHSVIAAWTFVDRFHWRSNDRYWFFNSTWAATFVDFRRTNVFNLEKNGVVFTSDQESMIPVLESQHRTLVDHYFDNQHLTEKLCNYSHSLRCLCQQRQIPLIEIDAGQNYALDITSMEDLGLAYIQERRHPNHQEHKIIADFVLKNFYQNSTNHV